VDVYVFVDPSLLESTAVLEGDGPGDTSAPMLEQVPECTSKQMVPFVLTPCGQLTVAFVLAEQNVELVVLRQNVTVSVTVVPTTQPGDMQVEGVTWVDMKSLCANAGVADAPKATSVVSSPRIRADFVFSRLIETGLRFSIYIASGALSHADEVRIHVA
jgi:hypothetical protein